MSASGLTPDAGADQLDMALRAVDEFTSAAQCVARPSDRLWTYPRKLLKEHRQRMAVWPVMEDGVLGGLDGEALASNWNATYQAPRPSNFLTRFDPNNPGHQNVPMIVPGWNLDHRWIVRTPDSIADVLDQINVPRGASCLTRCDCGHHDTARKFERISLLVLTSGQFLVLVPSCLHCAQHKDYEYGSGNLIWLEVSSAGRIKVGAGR